MYFMGSCRSLKGMVYVAACFALLIPLGAWSWELNESPAAPEEWGYRPGNGTVADINPPPFTWRPDETASAYDLQVAADESFETILYEALAIPWSSHCPDRVLPSGACYWRYRGRNDAGEPSNWSSVRNFEIPEDVPKFPMPVLDVLRHRIPEDHPRLFMTPDEIAGLQAMTESTLEAPWKSLLKQADTLLAQPPDTTEPPKYPPGTERKGPEWRRIWWGNRVHAIAVSDGAATLAFAYRMTGEQQYGEACRALMMALCDWDPKGATNYDYNDEAAMPLLYYPARAYTWAYDVFTPEERERIASMMRVRGEDCYNSLHRRNHLWRPYSSHHNRAWHKLGELATAFHDVIPEAPTWLDYIMTIFYTCYPVWGDADGGWHEGQAYWVSYLSRFVNWALVMQSPYGINVFEKPFFKHVGDFGLYTCPPGTQAGAFGDLAPNSNSERIAQFMGLMGAVADNPYWQWYCEQHGNPSPGGYFGLLIAARGRHVDVRTPDDLPSSKVFAGTGVAALNSTLLDGRENVQVHFKSSPFGTQSHGYNANNAFLLHVRGERALILSGRRDIHGSPHHQQWMWETKSDNAILVNGEGQYPHTPQALGRITHFHTSDRLDVVAGEAGDSYASLARWARRILFFKPGVILIHDVLEAHEPSTFQWLLHAEHPFILEEEGAALKTGTAHVDIAFLTPEDLQFSHTDEFDTPPHDWANFTLNEWHFTASTQKPAKSLAFVTLIRVDHAEAAAVLTEEDEGFRLKLTLPDADVEAHLLQDSFVVTGPDYALRWEDQQP